MNPFRVRHLLLTGTSALALALCSPYALGKKDTEAASSGSISESVRGLEEVVVTARHRRESMQESPIAVTALGGVELRERGIINIGELTKSVPSLEITEGVNNLIFIRGIGQRTAKARVDPTVGVYLDNIFLPRTDGQLLATVDVESVQVLRGPQGTLFGKNTTAGAMVLTLEKPKDEHAGYLSGSLGNYGHHQLRGAYNLPITDSLYARAAFNYLKDDGFLEDEAQSETNASKGRMSFIGQLRWEPNASLLIDSLFYVGKIDERLTGTNCTPLNSEDALYDQGLYLMWPGDTDARNPTAYRENCLSNSSERVGDLKVNMGPNSLMDRKLDTYLFGTTIDWYVSENQKLKVVIGARDETKGPLISTDQDGGPENFNESFNFFDEPRQSYSLELQLSGTMFDDAVAYTGGLFGLRETNSETGVLINSLNGVDAPSLAAIALGNRPPQPLTPLGTLPFVGILVDPWLSSKFDLKNETFAAFFQGSWNLNEQVELTVGVRWTQETRHSNLEVRGADREAIGQRLLTSGLGFGPAVEGFNPFFGSWLQDPVGLAMGLFPDADGDGFNDFPIAEEPIRTDSQSRTFEEVTPMASWSYQFESLPANVDSLMVYGTWSNGFKSGFFEPRGVDGLQPIEPERVENLEVGLKLEVFQRSMRFNMSAYDMDFTEQQLIQVDADSQNNLVVGFQNAGASEIKGAEIELQWMPSPNVLINLSASHNDSTFTEFSDNDLLQAVLGRTVPLDRSDEAFPISPESTFAFGMQYAIDTEIGLFTPRIDYSYKSDVYYGLDDGSFTEFQKDPDKAGQSAYSLVDLRLTWRDSDDTTVSAYIKNALDKRYDIGAAAVADTIGTYFSNYGDPRRFGIEIRKQF